MKKCVIYYLLLLLGVGGIVYGIDWKNIGTCYTKIRH